MRKKLVSLLSIGALSVGVLGACSNDEGTSGSESGSKDDVLKVWSFTDELKGPIKTYEERNGVKVELTIVPIADYPTKLKPALESGVGAPDVFTGEIAFLKQWVDAGYWENLSNETYNVNDIQYLDRIKKQLDYCGARDVALRLFLGDDSVRICVLQFQREKRDVHLHARHDDGPRSTRTHRFL